MHKRINLIPKLNLSKTMANPKRVYNLILSKNKYKDTRTAGLVREKNGGKRVLGQGFRLYKP